MTWIFLVFALVPRPDFAPVGQAELAAARRMAAAGFVTHQSSIANRQSAWDSPTEARVPGRFVVGFEPGGREAAASWVAQQGGSVIRVDEACGFFVADLPPGRESQPGQPARSAAPAGTVRYLEPCIKVQAAALPNDPYFIPYQWDKWVMYADKAWDVVGGSIDVKVAVVDEGVDYQHPDLAADFIAGELGYDFIGNDNDPQPDNPRTAFHGTHVAGIIAATRDNNEGIAGWSLVQLLSVRVLDDTGSGTTDVVASGVRWAADHGARIINMSLESSESSTPLLDACAYAEQAGVLIIAASGNSGQDAVSFPARYNECVAVGATSKDSRLAIFSNYGSEQELVAPGDTVWSSLAGGGYGWARGTSMASPQVAGVAALVLARNWGLSANEVRAILDASAIDMGLAGRDIQYGYGFVNARRAVDLAAAYAAGRSPSVAIGTGSPGADAHTVFVRAGSSLPSWVAQADVYDGSGRLIQVRGTDLRPGTYFARPGSNSEVRTPKSGPIRRLLVLD